MSPGPAPTRPAAAIVGAERHGLGGGTKNNAVGATVSHLAPPATLTPVAGSSIGPPTPHLRRQEQVEYSDGPQFVISVTFFVVPSLECTEPSKKAEGDRTSPS